LPGIVADYRHAAENALKAGFDGVEIHAANGYLLDQFLRDGTNKRTDSYGGSIENRVRFAIEATEAAIGIWGADRVGMRIAPVSSRNDMADSDPEPLFRHLVDRLNDLGLGYLHVIEGVTGGPREVEGGFDLSVLRRRFKGLYMANNGYTRALAMEAVAGGAADLVAFGRPFISNPDLVERLRRDAPLTPPDVATFYGGDEKGYLDYPSLGAE
jgi:N-ethylmaleimide reductase